MVRFTGMLTIAEGKRTKIKLGFVRRAQVTACQGWLWPDISPEQLNQLPDRLPEDNQG